MEDDGFTLVKAKKGKGQRKTIIAPRSLLNSTFISNPEDLSIDAGKFVSDIQVSSKAFSRSEYFLSFLETLKDHLSPESTVLTGLVCLGIGRFTSDRCSKHQLDFLFSLFKHLRLSGHTVLVYDPVLSKTEKDILECLEFCVLNSNDEGKFPIKESTLFYFPHCPKHLSNNLLWSNWSKESLSKVFLLSNSFERIRTNLPKKLVKQEGAEFILKASKLAKESVVNNSYRFNDVFNDTSLHSFPSTIIDKIQDPEFWERGPSPVYLELDAEFVANF